MRATRFSADFEIDGTTLGVVWYAHADDYGSKVPPEEMLQYWYRRATKKLQNTAKREIK
jgi:uncharacterized protein YccT (UPF0319 family)